MTKAINVSDPAENLTKFHWDTLQIMFSATVKLEIKAEVKGGLKLRKISIKQYMIEQRNKNNKLQNFKWMAIKYYLPKSIKNIFKSDLYPLKVHISKTVKISISNLSYF